MTKTKKTLWVIAAILPCIVAAYFIAPLKDWVEIENNGKLINKNINYCEAPNKIGYLQYCIDWWGRKLNLFSNYC